MIASDIKNLNDAVLRLYDSDSLKRLLYFGLSKKLEHIAGSGNFVSIVLEVIEASEREGWLLELLTEVYQSHRTDPAIASLAARYNILLDF